MTRFMQEICGVLGEYWEKDARSKVERYMAEAGRDAVVDADGAIKWKSNGHYLMDDYCEVLEFGGFDFNRKATAVKRDEQNDKFIAEYKERMKNHVRSDEELAEMRSAFGAGAVVVDVITGEKIRL